MISLNMLCLFIIHVLCLCICYELAQRLKQCNYLNTKLFIFLHFFIFFICFATAACSIPSSWLISLLPHSYTFLPSQPTATPFYLVLSKPNSLLHLLTLCSHYGQHQAKAAANLVQHHHPEKLTLNFFLTKTPTRQNTQPNPHKQDRYNHPQKHHKTYYIIPLYYKMSMILYYYYTPCKTEINSFFHSN